MVNGLWAVGDSGLPGRCGMCPLEGVIFVLFKYRTEPHCCDSPTLAPRKYYKLITNSINSLEAWINCP